MKARPYYATGGASAEFYDVLTAADRSLDGDVDLYAGLAPAGGAILELGSGTGRIAEALAARGLQVTGVELAPAMLAQAEARRRLLADDVACRIAYRRGDMTSLALGATFDAVICPFFGLAHLPAGAAWRNTFKGVAKHLKPGGRAAFHLPLAERMTGPAPPPETPVALHPLPDGRTLALHVAEKTFRPDIGRFSLTLDYVAGTERRREQLTYYLADPVPLAQTAGLTLDGAPTRLGGAGDVFVFRRSDDVSD